MGNYALCGEKGKCGEQCTQLTIVQPTEAKDWVEAPDPAGAVFAETLAGLNVVDRNLLVFSASNNLAAVRWLLVLGANREVADHHGTTILHAACRSGSLSIVEALVLLEGGGSKALSQTTAGEASQESVAVGGLERTDEVGWTPLHVAAFMGRHSVASVLLRSGANASPITTAGKTPADLCSDSATRALILRAAEQMRGDMLKRSGSSSQQLLEGADETGGSGSHEQALLDVPATSEHQKSSQGALQVESSDKVNEQSRSSEIRFEPFFVPRQSLIKEEHKEPEFVALCAQLGAEMFERQPGRALAFLVSTGCVRDYPIDLVAFLRDHRLSPSQIGTFLSEDFSLSKILRMEFLNSVCLLETGVITALRKGLAGLKVPQDLQKMNRLLGSLAEVWWRQQLRAGRLMKLKKEDDIYFAGLEAFVDVVSDDEVRGPELKRLLPSANSLHQLLFSTVMLHWNLYAPLPRSQRLSFEAWAALNCSGGREDLPEWILVPIFKALAREPLEELSIEPPVPSNPPSAATTSRKEYAAAEAGLESDTGGDAGCSGGLDVDGAALTAKSNTRGMPMSHAAVREDVDRNTENAGPEMYGEDAAGDGGSEAPSLLSELSSKSLYPSHRRLSGWVRVFGDGLPAVIGDVAGSSVGYSECMQMTGMLSEATASARHASARLRQKPCNAPSLQPPSVPGGTPLVQLHGLLPSERSQKLAAEAVWLSLTGPLLFLGTESASTLNPFAYVCLKFAQLVDIDPARSMFALDGGNTGIPSSRESSQCTVADSLASRPIEFVMLLPDGRWQSYQVQKLMFQVSEQSQLKDWIARITELRRRQTTELVV